ncbi:MAG: universal stress protein [Cryobacterium sp.]
MTHVPHKALLPASPTVVAWNGSPQSRAALLWALERERAGQGALTLLAVIDEAFRSCGAAAMAELALIARSALSAEIAWARQAAPTVTVTAQVLTGDPKEQILLHCPPGALLVVGHREPGTPGERGSLAAQLSALAAVPVVLVAAPPETEHTDVVVGVDGSQASRQACLVAAAEARLRQSAVRLVHAWPGVVDGVLEADGQGHAEHRALLNAEVNTIREAFLGLTVHGVLESGSATGVLQRHAHDAAALVVGSRGHGPVKRLLLGSVSRALVLRVDCPLIIVKADPA